MPHDDSSVRLAVSSCLLGNAVRYDGGHRYNAYVAETLARHCELLAFCPEVAIGLGTPRPPIRLVRVEGSVRVRGVDDSTRDVTEALSAHGREVANGLRDVSGYVFKKGSPSCGVTGVPIFGPTGQPLDSGPGRYAAAIMAQLPALPVVDEAQLCVPVQRDNFIQRVFVYQRWQQMRAAGLSAAGLVAFHSRHKFIIAAHDEPAYRRLGRLVGSAGSGQLQTLAPEYLLLLMQSLQKPATPKQHANVLMHLMGFIKHQLSHEEKAELLALIDDYRREQIPWLVPVTLLRHFLQRYPNEYLSAQYYLNPHPTELLLRNQA